MSYVDYPTEKNHNLLERIIRHSSDEESYVLDAFAGSGSTLLTASKLGRKWIGIDESDQSHKVMQQRFTDKEIAYQLFEYEENA